MFEFEEITDYKIYSVWPEQRYEVLKKWEYSADVVGAKSGTILLFITRTSLVYSEIDDDPLYGGGSAKREKVQQISNYLTAGPIHPFNAHIEKEIDAFVRSLQKT